jgi:hypothetical protein
MMDTYIPEDSARYEGRPPVHGDIYRPTTQYRGETPPARELPGPPRSVRRPSPETFRGPITPPLASSPSNDYMEEDADNNNFVASLRDACESSYAAAPEADEYDIPAQGSPPGRGAHPRRGVPTLQQRFTDKPGGSNGSGRGKGSQANRGNRGRGSGRVQSGSNHHPSSNSHQDNGEPRRGRAGAPRTSNGRGSERSLVNRIEHSPPKPSLSLQARLRPA